MTMQIFVPFSVLGARAPSWRFAAASATGSSHVSSGLPCQDAWRVAVCPSGPGRGALVAAAADGAGTAAHSDVGARAAVDGVVLAALERLGAKRRIDARDLRDLLFEARERVLDAARALDAPLREFACTLLVAIMMRQGAVFAQIGDGAIVVRDGDGWRCVFWPKHGEYANATTFLTDEDGVDNAQFDTVEAAPTDIALFTDGLERLVLETEAQRPHGPFFDAMFAPMHASVIAGNDDALSLDLAAYLASPAVLERTDDDTTLILATRAALADA